MITGIIRNVRLGSEDHHGVALSFDTYISECSAARHWLPLDRAEPLLGRYEDFRSLEGKPCWVDTDTPGIIRFVRLWDS